MSGKMAGQLQAVQQIRNELLSGILREQIREIIREELTRFVPAEKIVILREISRDEAMEEIRELFASGKTLYYSDIASQLRLDLELVVDICKELMSRGEIAVDENLL